MYKQLICTCCPMGCYLTLNYAESKILNVTGNRCKIGQEYAEKEFSNPERILTTTIEVKGGLFPLVSVRTNKPVPKNKIFDIMNLLAKVELKPPIKIGGIVIKNVLNLGVDIVATKNVPLIEY